MANTPRNTKTSPQPTADPAVTTTRKASCKSLEGQGKLTYELGTDSGGAVYVRIRSNSGGGFFSDEWISFGLIRSALQGWPKDSAITSMALRGLFKGKSVNTPSFLLAVLLVEGVVKLIDGKRRQYEINDLASFTQAVKGKTSSHSRSRPSPTPRKKSDKRSMTPPKTS
jgi:hypothetical protein